MAPTTEDKATLNSRSLQQDLGIMWLWRHIQKRGNDSIGVLWLVERRDYESPASNYGLPCPSHLLPKALKRGWAVMAKEKGERGVRGESNL